MTTNYLRFEDLLLERIDKSSNRNVYYQFQKNTNDYYFRN